MREIASETQIGQLVIDLKIKTEALEKGMESAKKKLQELEQQNEQVKNSNQELNASFVAISAGIIASMYKITGVIKESIEEYNAYKQAMSSLSDVAEYTNNNFDDMSQMMEKYSKYMTKSDIAATIKNFSLMNMTMEQTDQMLQSLINSAIKNRNANYTVSEAVKVASDGYKQGLSTLSDSAGVTENLSVMLDNYAKSIGKTASQLTEEEQNQAYVNRTMESAAPFANAMSEYLDTLAGKQGTYSQALRETQVAYAEAMEPTLIRFEEFKTSMITGLGNIINQNQEATAGITVFIATLGTLAAGILIVKKAYDVYTKSVIAAKVAQDGFNASAEANPVGITITVLATAVSAIAGATAAIDTQKEKQVELTEAQRQYNEVLRGTIELNSENVSSMKTTKSELENYLKELEENGKNIGTLNFIDQALGSGKLDNGQVEEFKKIRQEISAENSVLYADIKKSSDQFKKMFGIEEEGIITQQKATDILKAYTKRLDEASSIEKAKSLLDVESVKTQQKNAAQLKANANQMQEYLNIVKSGDKSTSSYQNAVKQLSKAYGEASTAAGINVDAAQECINADQARADQAWNTSQATIQGNIEAITTFISLAEAAANDEAKQSELANTIGIEYNKIIPTLTTILNLLNLIGNRQPTDVPNVTPTTVTTPKATSSGGSKSYSNKALDNYKKQIEHKKALDQLSINEEISMYEYALKKYAKTADEKNEIREKIYELNKELAQKEKDLLDQQTEDYENYIQDQKNARGAAYDITEQTADYNKIIQMHRNYLNQIMKDERLSLDERKEIYREELSTIRDYEQQKRDLRVEQIDNTVTQLTNAITKQLEEMQEKDKAFIDKQLEDIEKLKESRINAINEEYDAKIEAIEKELEALDKAEQEKTRDEEDAEYERKKKRLQQLIDYEHDATTKANYQKELDKLVAEYKKTLDKRALEDKKEALNAQKDLLQKEQDDKTQAIEDETDKQKELYEKQLDDLEEYYNKQIDKAQETAEKMLLNVEQNQDKILELLKNYGDAYEITGQTLGEKLAQGMNEGIASKIEGMIQRVQDTINAGIENKLKEWSSGMYRYEVGSDKPKTQTINVYQTNNIEQNPEMPSETYRKLNNVSENLAAQLRAEGL